MTSISIPNNWAPRDYQLPFWRSIVNNKTKRAVAVCHRRWGKDSCAINMMAVKAVTEPGLYYYMAPTQKHARRIIWDNVGRDGLRITTQAFPEEIRKSTNDQEMRIVVEANGGKESIFQVVGSDNYDSIVGSNPRGIVFSEWAICAKPEAWEYFRPILAENDGWAAFIYTPRGLNHGYSLYTMALDNPDWFCELQTVDDTWGKGGTMSPEKVQAERDAGMSELAVQTEFYCEFTQSVENQVFDGVDIERATKKAREIQGEIDEKKIDTHRAAQLWPFSPHDPTIVGVDVAYYGDDSTVIATRRGKDGASIPPIRMQGKEPDQVAARLAEHCKDVKADAVFIDATGLGITLARTMQREYGIAAKGIQFQSGPMSSGVYENIKAEMYFKFAEWLADPEVALHGSEQMRKELAAILYFQNEKTGLMQLQSKKDTKKMLGGHSPDLADAYALTFAREVPPKGGEDRGPIKAVISW